MTGTVAVVPAAGSGERLAAGVPKAFYQLDGRTLVERAVDGLLESGVVDRVVVAVPADRTDRAKLILGGDATVVAGGANRGDSVSRALAAVTDGRRTRVCAGARRRAGSDTARAGGARGRGAAGRASGRRPGTAAVRHHQGRRRQRRGAGHAGTGRAARGADPAGFRHRTCCCGPTSRPERPSSPTTRPWSSTSAVRFRWSTATRWRSRSPPGWTCCWRKRCDPVNASGSALGTDVHVIEARQAVLAAGPAVSRRRRLRRALRRRRRRACAVRCAAVGGRAGRYRRRVRRRRPAVGRRQRYDDAAPRRRSARRSTAIGSATRPSR